MKADTSVHAVVIEAKRSMSSEDAIAQVQNFNDTNISLIYHLLLQVIGYYIALSYKTGDSATCPLGVVVTEFDISLLLFPFKDDEHDLLINALFVGTFPLWEQGELSSLQQLCGSTLGLFFTFCSQKFRTFLTGKIPLPEDVSAIKKRDITSIITEEEALKEEYRKNKEALEEEYRKNKEALEEEHRKFKEALEEMKDERRKQEQEHRKETQVLCDQISTLERKLLEHQRKKTKTK